MRKLLMVLFLFGTISVFCNAQIDGYYVKDSGNLALFADGEPRTSTSIGIEAGKSVEIRFTQPSTGDFLWQKRVVVTIFNLIPVGLDVLR